jgi:tetratricopeptide (TPR) repeat protein
MNRKIKNIILISGAVVLFTLSLLTYKFISDNNFRKQLPEYPDFEGFPELVKAQILDAGRKTYWNPTENNLGMLGMVYYSCANYEKANQCYQLALLKNNASWIWNYYSGYLDLELGESKASVENFRHVFEKDPKNIMALFYMAEAYQNLGMIINAEDIFKKITVLKEGDIIKRDTIRENDFSLSTYALFRLARIYMNSNQLDSAEMTLKEIISHQIAFGPAYRLLGAVYTRQGNLSLGNKYTIRANDMAEYTPPPDILIDKIALISRSDTYLLKQIDDAIRSENYQWALKLCTHALKYIPDNKYLISKTIFGYFVLGLDKKALPYLDQHISYFSDDFNELIHLAELLYNRGYELQAMKYFNQAKKIKPGNSRLALWLLERGMENGAISLLNDQLKKDPENVKILSDAANMMLKIGNKEKATGYLNVLKRISPSNPDGKKLAGMIAEREGDLIGALSIYEESFKSDPKDLNIIKYLSALYIREKMWNKAIIHFRSALVSYPNEPFLLEGLGKLLLSCPDPNFRNVDEGREYSERTFINYKSTFATKVSACKDLATAFAISGDKQKASEYIDLAIELARKKNIPLDFTYFETLRKQYKISN